MIANDVKLWPVVDSVLVRPGPAPGIAARVPHQGSLATAARLVDVPLNIGLDSFGAVLSWVILGLPSPAVPMYPGARGQLNIWPQGTRTPAPGCWADRPL